MPTYTIPNRVDRVAERRAAILALINLLQHLVDLNFTITTITIGTGGNAGRPQVTTTETLPADQATHLGVV